MAKEKEIEFMVRLKGKQAKYLSDFVDKGYYATKSEVVRAGILELAHKHKTIDEKPSKEEVILVNKAIAKEMDKIKKGKIKTYTLEEVLKKYPDMKN